MGITSGDEGCAFIGVKDEEVISRSSHVGVAGFRVDGDSAVLSKYNAV